MSLVGPVSKMLLSWGPRLNPWSGNYIPHTVNKSLHAVTKDPVCVCMHAQPCLSLFNPMDCNPPGHSVRGILQAWILEWVTISNSRGSSQPRGQIYVSLVFCIGRSILPHWANWEALNTPHAAQRVHVLQLRPSTANPPCPPKKSQWTNSWASTSQGRLGKWSISTWKIVQLH